MTNRCLKRFKFAFSKDNDDNIRSGGCMFLCTVVALLITVLIPPIGYVTTLPFSASCPEDDICVCLNMSLSYRARYTTCLFSLLGTASFLALVGFLFLGLYLFWRYEIPLMRNEIINASTPPIPEVGQDDEEDEITSLLSTKAKKVSFFWLISPKNPNTLLQSPNRTFLYISILLLVLVLGILYPIGALINSKYFQACQKGNWWLCSFTGPCNTTKTIDFTPGCSIIGIGGLLVSVCVILLLGGVLWYGYLSCIEVKVAFKKPEEIDSIIAIKTMERARI